MLLSLVSQPEGVIIQELGAEDPGDLPLKALPQHQKHLLDQGALNQKALPLHQEAINQKVLPLKALPQHQKHLLHQEVLNQKALPLHQGALYQKALQDQEVQLHQGVTRLQLVRQAQNKLSSSDVRCQISSKTIENSLLCFSSLSGSGLYSGLFRGGPNSDVPGGCCKFYEPGLQ